MGPMKTGYIVQIKGDIAVVKEHSTLTEWIVFLDKVPTKTRQDLRINSWVSFSRNTSYEQFVIDQIELDGLLRKSV